MSSLKNMLQQAILGGAKVEVIINVEDDSLEAE
jgi:hypothetical protein